MIFHKKIGSWFVDYGYMLRGTAVMTMHKSPPKHYLGHVVEGKVPVVLIPGILGKWGLMKKLGDSISLTGHPVYIVPKLGYNIYDIPSSARVLHSIVRQVLPPQRRGVPHVAKGAEAIREVLEKSDLKGVVLVSHSKGGLIGKYLLSHYNADGRVLGMVSIATPYSGSALAKLVPHDAFKELKNDSKIIHDLESHTEVNPRIISVIPEYDHYVWAAKGSFLDGAENIEVPVSGHIKVLFSKEVREVVLRSIEKISKLRTS